MKPKLLKPLITLLTLLSLLLGFFGGIQYQKRLAPTFTTSPSHPSSATVSRIIDGDTLELTTGQQVRLTGVSAPDHDEPFYDEATNFTKQLTENQTINLEYESGYESDKFACLLAYVFIGDANLNLALVRSGLARVIYQKRRPLIYQNELLAAQSYAQENKLGIWSD